MSRPRRLLAALVAGSRARGERVLVRRAAPRPREARRTPAAAAPVRPAPEATAAASTDASRRPRSRRTRCAVVIERLTPGVAARRGATSGSRGTVTNVSEPTGRDLSVYLLTSPEPMTTAAELAEAVASDPTTDVGDRIVDARPLHRGPGPRARASRRRFELSVPARPAGRSRAPPASTGSASTCWAPTTPAGCEGADGRARTFLPLVPERNPDPELALGMQFRKPRRPGLRRHGWSTPQGLAARRSAGERPAAHGCLDLGASAPADRCRSAGCVDPAAASTPAGSVVAREPRARS